MKKRVRCLYRVSTKKQGEKDDIPMQRISCTDFIKNKEDWIFDNEYIELGVSGYKLSESDRDVLQEIKKDVLKEEFDVLLVFMFDRIGRREEETPFVVEWLIDHNIEVWSVKEGQRKIESRADKLINYLTYWQAGGESEKTSIRVREAQEQMAEKGILTYGGERNAPYGYKFIKSGTYTKKGVERQKLIKNDEEKENAYRIYYLYTVIGYGIGSIAKIFNNEHIKARRGKLWTNSTIANILSNPIYMGYPAYSKKTSRNMSSRKKLPFEDWILPKNRIEGLAIVSEKTWYKAQEIRKSRNRNENTKCSKPVQTKSPLLLIGMIKCGECGYSFTTSESKKTKKNGDIQKYIYYRCSSTRFTHNCSLEKKSYKKEELEGPIINTVLNFLDSMEKIDLSEVLKEDILNNNQKEQKELIKCNQKIIELENKLIVLKDEVVKTLTGNSNFSQELLNELIENTKNEKEKIEQERKELNKIINQKNLNQHDVTNFKNMIPVWKKEFTNANFEIKKMLLSEIIKEIKVFNNKIEIVFRIEISNYKSIIYDINDKLNTNYCKIIENTICLQK